jgi:hypothetical protein
LSILRARRKVKLDVFKKGRRLALATAALLLGFTLLDLAGDMVGAAVCATDADTEDSSATRRGSDSR